MTQARKPNILTMLLVTIISFLAIFYFIIAMNTGNWGWILRNTDLDKPDRIVVSISGEREIINPDNDKYALLANAIGQSVSDIDSTALIPIALSDTAVEDYKTKSFIIEVHYTNSATFNAMFRVGEPNRLLIPIEGRYAGDRLFFRGNWEEWWFGGIRMASDQPIYDALGTLGYLSD